MQESIRNKVKCTRLQLSYLFHIMKISDTVFAFEKVKSAGYAFAVSCHFLTYNAVYFQLWRTVNDERLPFYKESRLLYSKKIQPILTGCRTDVSLALFTLTTIECV